MPITYRNRKWRDQPAQGRALHKSYPTTEWCADGDGLVVVETYLGRFRVYDQLTRVSTHRTLAAAIKRASRVLDQNYDI